MSYTLFADIGELLTLQGARQKGGRSVNEADLSIIKKAALICHKGQIVWLGSQNKIAKSFAAKVNKEISLKNRTVTPGLIECHTHTLFAGDRAAEFEMRNQGVSYLEIAKRGGGILSTMKAVRKATPADLLAQTQKRVDHFVKQGITTLEVKTGYGLSVKEEMKSLKVIEGLTGPRIVSTFLGAHAKGPEFATHEEYLVHLQNEALPIIKNKTNCRRVDIFIEKGFFEKEASRRFLLAAKNLGFDLTIHGDQLSLSGGTDLAVELGALSVDHVIQIDEPAIQKLAASNTTAVLLPMADLYMKCAYPPARKLIDAGARVALATDFNPGSCPSQDVQLVGLLARLQMGMTQAEVLSAYTVGSAFSLGLENRIGHLDLGLDCDLVAWDCEWSQLFYEAGANIHKNAFRHGKKIH